MDPQLWLSVSDRLNRTLGEIESRRRVSIQPSVRSFISDLVLESFLLRDDEWRRRADVDPDNVSDADVSNASKMIDEVVRRILNEAAADSSVDGGKQILLIGAVEQVHRQFCGIFPFCR